ncbi:hypothetical protein BLNAU_1437 [Blattamonas nauphoetae]|uniref:Uncharacterized protein n=1 Tax=Blattamonas nauphoetae TaxID=2049346 RepID=A0ABQ9YIB2_9EUKA|nr:hypothetical protein BLNAU_1437 [Blattamonas nauphoetae]
MRLIQSNDEKPENPDHSHNSQFQPPSLLSFFQNAQPQDLLKRFKESFRTALNRINGRPSELVPFVQVQDVTQYPPQSDTSTPESQEILKQAQLHPTFHFEFGYVIPFKISTDIGNTVDSCLSFVIQASNQQTNTPSTSISSSQNDTPQSMNLRHEVRSIVPLPHAYCAALLFDAVDSHWLTRGLQAQLTEIRDAFRPNKPELSPSPLPINNTVSEQANTLNVDGNIPLEASPSPKPQQAEQITVASPSSSPLPAPTEITTRELSQTPTIVPVSETALPTESQKQISHKSSSPQPETKQNEEQPKEETKSSQKQMTISNILKSMSKFKHFHYRMKEIDGESFLVLSSTAKYDGPTPPPIKCTKDEEGNYCVVDETGRQRRIHIHQNMEQTEKKRRSKRKEDEETEEEREQRYLLKFQSALEKTDYTDQFGADAFWAMLTSPIFFVQNDHFQENKTTDEHIFPIAQLSSQFRWILFDQNQLSTDNTRFQFSTPPAQLKNLRRGGRGRTDFVTFSEVSPSPERVEEEKLLENNLMPITTDTDSLFSFFSDDESLAQAHFAESDDDSDSDWLQADFEAENETVVFDQPHLLNTIEAMYPAPELFSGRGPLAESMAQDPFYGSLFAALQPEELTSYPSSPKYPLYPSTLALYKARSSERKDRRKKRRDEQGKSGKRARDTTEYGDEGTLLDLPSVSASTGLLAMDTIHKNLYQSSPSPTSPTPLATQSPQNYPISTPLQPLSLQPFTPLPKQNHGPTNQQNIQPPTQSPPQPLPGAFINSAGLLVTPPQITHPPQHHSPSSLSTSTSQNHTQPRHLQISQSNSPAILSQSLTNFKTSQPQHSQPIQHHLSAPQSPAVFTSLSLSTPVQASPSGSILQTSIDHPQSQQIHPTQQNQNFYTPSNLPHNHQSTPALTTVQPITLPEASSPLPPSSNQPAPQGSIPISEPSQTGPTTLTKISDQPDGHAPVPPQITQRNHSHRSEQRNPPSQSADLPKSQSPSTPIVSIDSAQLETISTAISSGHLGSIQKGRQNSTNTRGNIIPFPANLGQMMLNNATSLKGTRTTSDGQQGNPIQTVRPLPLLPIVEGEQLGKLKPLPLVPPKGSSHVSLPEGKEDNGD